ncbi:glycosyltransferase [Clostridium botulinum]|nr:glycosyltransferase [Clostridium botulinum]
MCKVSVIMPVYNEKKEWLIKSIESICNQTFKDFEFIIILDNPNNNELKIIIEEFSQKDMRIKYYINEKNLGLVETLNKGLKISKGEFIARMDADDISHPERFKKQVKFLLENSEIKLVGTNWNCINKNDNILFKHGPLPTKFNFIKKNIKYNNMFLHPSWMFRRTILSQLKGYRDLIYCEDFDFITRCITNNIKISNINEYLMLYRVRETSISMSKAYEQYVNTNRAVTYMKQRYKNGFDNYIKDKKNINNINIKEKERFLKATELFLSSRESLKEKKICTFILKFFKSFLISRDRCRKNFNLIIFNFKLIISR